MATRSSADASMARDALPDRRRCVPWKTVVTLAAVLAYADGYWLVSLRGAIGAIERTDHPFASWLRESTTVLPVFVFAVLAALTLALHWFSPKVGETRTVVATALLIVVGGTLVGVAAAGGQCGLRLPAGVRPAARHARDGRDAWPLRHELSGA